MTRNQVDEWATGIESKTLTPEEVPAAWRDAVQMELLRRWGVRRGWKVEGWWMKTI